MNKENAVKWYKAIQNGQGVDRDEYLPVLKRGKIAEDLWNEGSFTLGIEYGVLIALIRIFNLKTEDLTTTNN